MTVREWAERNLWITEGPLIGESGAPIRWSVDAFPLQAAPLDAIDDPRWGKVLLMTGPQTFGKTTGVMNPLLLYGVCHCREPVIYMSSAQDDAGTQYREKIKPALDEYDAHSNEDDLVPENPDLGGTHYYRTYANGAAMHVLGAESVGRLSGKTARIGCVDDAQAYPENLPKFGHPADYVMGRVASYPGEATRMVFAGTAGTVGCWLWRMLCASAFYCPFVPCLECGTYQLLTFEQLEYDADDAGAAKADACLRCAGGCDHPITFDELPEMLTRHLWASMPPDADWVLRGSATKADEEAADPEAPAPDMTVTLDPASAVVYPETRRNTNVAGFWANVLYWPWGRTWGEHAVELMGRQGDPDRMLDHRQNFQVRPFEPPKTDEEEEAIEPADLETLRTDTHRWGTVPAVAGVHEGKGVLVATGDVHGGFVWYMVEAWNLETGSSWLVELGRFGKRARTDPAEGKRKQQRVWKSRVAEALDGLWAKEAEGWPIIGEGGEIMGQARIPRKAGGGIDCGFLAETVQTWCHARNGGRWTGTWLPIRGSKSRADGKIPIWPGIANPSIDPKTHRRCWECNTNRAKLYVREILAIPPGQPGSMTLPADMPDWCRTELGKQFAAEHWNSKRGTWKQVSHANHLLDCKAEQVIMARACGVKFDALAGGPKAEPKPKRRVDKKVRSKRPAFRRRPIRRRYCER